MGFFKKLFGISAEEETSNYNKNEHEYNAPQNKVETKSEKPTPNQSNNPNMTSWENFFGLNLKASNMTYGQSFGVSKRERNVNVGYVTLPTCGKLVFSLVVTIFTMLPSYAINAYNVNLLDFINTQSIIQSDTEIIILKGNFSNASSGGATALLELISDDGNDNDAETLNVIFTSKQRYGKPVDGKRVLGERPVIDSYRPNSIIKCKVYTKKNGKEVFEYDTYYLQGDLTRTRQAMTAVEDPNIVLEPTLRSNVKNAKRQISEDFYNFLEQNFSKRLQKVTDKELKEEDDDNPADVFLDIFNAIGD